VKQHEIKKGKLYEMRNRRKHVEMLRSGKVIGKYVTMSRYLSAVRDPQLHEQVGITIARCLQPTSSPQQGKPQQASQVARLTCSGREHVGIRR